MSARAAARRAERARRTWGWAIAGGKWDKNWDWVVVADFVFGVGGGRKEIREEGTRAGGAEKA